MRSRRVIPIDALREGLLLGLEHDESGRRFDLICDVPFASDSGRVFALVRAEGVCDLKYAGYDRVVAGMPSRFSARDHVAQYVLQHVSVRRPDRCILNLGFGTNLGAVTVFCDSVSIDARQATAVSGGDSRDRPFLYRDVETGRVFDFDYAFEWMRGD